MSPVGPRSNGHLPDRGKTVFQSIDFRSDQCVKIPGDDLGFRETLPQWLLATFSLHRGRSRRVLARVVSDRSGLFRVAWPDIGLSDLANLTRCKAAAREWAERNAVLDDRKTNAARRLKSLNNFWWSASYVR